LPFRDNSDHLNDILQAIDLINTFLEGVTFESYQDDLKTKSAVERQLQIVTEAAYRLGDDAEKIAPGPDWANIRGMGNILRHAYHRINDRFIWVAVKDDLPAMREVILKALSSES
jgi:uncharacterized protein with HEPN domain